MAERAAGAVVLLVDDDRGILRAVGAALELEGFEVIPASGGRAALEAAERASPDVMLLDLAMPDLDGLEVVRLLRERGDEIPICILSARDEIQDRVRGLEIGADDYVVKPFALEEVVARLHALLRRRPVGDTGVLEVGDLRLDPQAHAASRGGREFELTRREFDLLALFMRHPGEVLDRARLHEDVWGYTFDPGHQRRRRLRRLSATQARGRPRAARAAHGSRRRLRPASLMACEASAAV